MASASTSCGTAWCVLADAVPGMDVCLVLRRCTHFPTWARCTQSATWLALVCLTRALFWHVGTAQGCTENFITRDKARFLAGNPATGDNYLSLVWRIVAKPLQHGNEVSPRHRGVTPRH